MTSRWANADDNAESEVQRKQQKAQKRKLREEKQRKLEEVKATEHQQATEEESEPSKKHQKTASPSQDGAQEDAHLLEFTNPSYGPSRSLDLYEVLNNIEEGSYGLVSRAKLKASGDIVALKRLKLDHRSQEGFPVTGLREIQTLRACEHPHIVKLREVIVTSQPVHDVYIVMDFLEHDLKTILEDMDNPFSPSETKTLMQQICSATEYLHSNWIMHRDLKTSNLLLNNRGEIKLADFGMARYTSSPPPKVTQLVVTLWYRAPELLLGAEEYGFEIDVWSIGCIFAELLTREPVFQGKNEVGQLSAIFNLLGTPTRESWPEFRSLPNAKALHPLLSNSQSSKSNLTASKFPYLTKAGLRLLLSTLSLDPNGRPSASQILQHPYFKEDPRPKAKEMFPTFPSKAGQERRRRRHTPQAPDRGEAPKMEAGDFASIFASSSEEQSGGGFALRMG